jgi:hypothetical protein
MIWWYYSGAFIAGGMLCYMLLALYVAAFVKRDYQKFPEEGKKLPKGWYLRPRSILKILITQRDHARKRAGELERLLQEVSLKFGETEVKLQSMRNRVAVLEKQNSGLTEQLKDTGSLLTESTSEAGNDRNRVTSSGEKVPLYFSIPEADGSFSEDKGELIQDERKFFRITPVPGTHRGELHFLSGRFDRKAIENIDYYLFPVCEVLNTTLRENASGIIQVECGRVIFHSGIWKMEKKVMVKLV